MGFDFSNFAALGVADKTAEYVLYEWQGDLKPVLILKPGGSENRPYFNAALRELGQADARAMRGQKLSGAQLDKTREIVRKLYPEHIVAGWRHFVDANGVEVPFSVAAVRDLFAQLPDWILDGIRAFCDDPQNFLSDGAAPVDSGAVAGNSLNGSNGNSATAGTAGL